VTNHTDIAQKLRAKWLAFESAFDLEIFKDQK